MSTLAVRRPRGKPERRVRLMRPPSDESPGLLIISVGNDQQPYTITPLASQLGGRGFRLAKIEVAPVEPDQPLQAREVARYCVHLAGELSSCECPGYLRHGMCRDGRGCKHIASLTKLTELGKL